MRLIFVILLFTLFVNNSVFANSTFSDSQSRFRLEAGKSFFNFYDGQGLRNAHSEYYIAQALSPYNFSVGYSFKTKYWINAEFSSYNLTLFDHKIESDFDIAQMKARVIRVSIVRDILIFQTKNHEYFVRPSFSIMHRKGFDKIVLEYPANPFPRQDYKAQIVDSNGFGISAGFDLSIIAYKQLSFSSSVNFSWVSEKGLYEQNTPNHDTYKSHIPIKGFLTVFPKIGFVF
jgi:hypothetical protein